MAELFGGALLSAFLQALVDRLASEDVVGFFRGKQAIAGVLNELKIVLLSANKLLNDAEEKLIRDENVRNWLDMLRDEVFHADDLVDSIEAKALGRKLKTTSIISIFSDTTLKKEAAEILKRLKGLLEEKDVLGLRGIVRSEIPSQRPIVPLADESSVYGREVDKEAIVLSLLSDDACGETVSVIPIVGMGGIGKTTLSQLVYNDDRVVRHFEIRAWITVSFDFDVLKLTNILLEKVTSEKCKNPNEELFEVQQRLKEALSGKRLLFVLDDVWNEDPNKWTDLREPFKSAADGSKIIVTARNTAVVSSIAGRQPHGLSDLSPEDGWRLFARHAFGSNADPHAHQDLQAIGREIVNKCKGLPLAIKSLGGLLRSKRNPKEWENILKSDVWDELCKKEGNILPALWLSYRHMPTHLKQCFSYCSLFPKDYEFEKEKIILLWMAEGFLGSDKQGTTIEEIGEEYFEDLLSRSMFQRSARDYSILVMHHLVHDLAMFVSGGFCFRLDESSNADELQRLASQTRHFFYGRHLDEPAMIKGICKAKCLRTCLFVTTPHLPRKLLSTLRFLRVLCLRGYSKKKLPGSIGNLIHLRYLDLSHSDIEKLPSSVCTLYNLQTLLLSCCTRLTALPKNMERLTNLRHLAIDEVPLEENPPQLYKMKSLKTLSKIVVGGGGNRGPKINPLKDVRPLCGVLEISGIENVESPMEALEANLKDKKGITDLRLTWKYCLTVDITRSVRDREVLDSLQPHANLRELSIKSYEGTVFSDWVGHASFSNVVSVSLNNCISCRSLPPLGQLPSLKRLVISRFDSVVAVGDEFCGNSPSFRCLENLEISGMREWKEWSFGEDMRQGRVFPRLTLLRLSSCPKLDIIFPDNLAHPCTAFPSLVELYVVYCFKLDSFLECLPHSKLEQLTLDNCGKLFQRDLHRLSSLKSLTISDMEIVSFPCDGFFLPPTLTRLDIKFSFNLVALNGKAFQQLTSLQLLNILWCFKLRCLPDEGLPASLNTLDIRGCHLLTKRCEKNKGKDWPKIEHINSIELDCITIQLLD